jgi:phosphoglycolate phosphatase-like HAD superfamily hydrolase
MSERTLVLFDRDGTLLDYSEMFFQFMLDLYVKHEVESPDRATVLSLAFWQQIVNHDLHVGSCRVKDLVNDIPREYMRFGLLYEGVRDAILSLRKSGVRMAIVSGWVGSEQTRRFVAEQGLEDCFDSIFTCDDLPHSVSDNLSSGYLSAKTLLCSMALDRLASPRDRVIMVGDSPEDIQAGRHLNARTVAVLTGNGSRLLEEIRDRRPDWIIGSAAEVPEVVRAERQRGTSPG